jgi:hypothetical protein
LLGCADTEKDKINVLGKWNWRAVCISSGKGCSGKYHLFPVELSHIDLQIVSTTSTLLKGYKTSAARSEKHEPEGMRLIKWRHVCRSMSKSRKMYDWSWMHPVVAALSPIFFRDPLMLCRMSHCNLPGADIHFGLRCVFGEETQDRSDEKYDVSRTVVMRESTSPFDLVCGAYSFQPYYLHA